MIRMAGSGDLEFLMIITQEFNDKLYGVPLNIDKTWDTLELIVEGPMGVAYVSDRGAIVGTIEEDPFRNYTVLQERGWYATDRSGLRLLRAFIQHGIDIGVDEIRMTTLEINPAAERLLEHSGFDRKETSWGLRVRR